MEKITNQKVFDLIVIGGGAAGIMAGISFKRSFPDKEVMILDRSFELGRKILVCGAGRCNLTNINLKSYQDSEVFKHFYTSSSSYGLIQSVFGKFSYNEIIHFFEELGVEVYTERKTNIGKIFPITDSAKTITEVLFQELNDLGVEVKTLCEVTLISKSENTFKVKVKKVELSERKMTDLRLQPNYLEEDEITFQSQYLIVSTGGKTYPVLGSNGSGYPLLQDLGHKIIDPVPSALPLVSKNPICKLLSGQKIELLATSIINGKQIKSSFDDIMFTDYGLSGPAILNLSREISISINRLKNLSCKVNINFLTNQDGTPREYQWFEDRLKKKKSVYKALVGVLPNKMAKVLDERFSNNFDYNSSTDVQKLFENLTGYSFDIIETKSWNEAEFTSGGVDLSEVKNTLESKVVDKLFFAGEVLDVDGDVGGYNLSWAWGSGWLAGKIGK